jgi:hypothetical protein
MRKLLLLQVLFITINGWSQSADSIHTKEVKPKLTGADSNAVSPGKFNDSLQNIISSPGSIPINENMERNITGLIELQKTHRAREKRNAMVRIGIGIAFLIILIAGLRRKAKKK